jgi:hypothetical protein
VHVALTLAASDGPRWGRLVGLVGALVVVLAVRTVVLHLMGHRDPVTGPSEGSEDLEP